MSPVKPLQCLPIPRGAFDHVYIPHLDGPVGLGDELHRLWLCRLLLVAAQTMRVYLGQLPTPEGLLNQIQDIEGIDQLYIRYAEHYLPRVDTRAWGRIAQQLVNLTDRGLPQKYKHRDRRVAAIKLDTGISPPPSEDRLLSQLCLLTDLEPSFYRALVVPLRQRLSDCEQMAQATLDAIQAIDDAEGLSR